MRHPLAFTRLYLKEQGMAWKWDFWFGYWALVWLVIASVTIWQVYKRRSKKAQEEHAAPGE